MEASAPRRSISRRLSRGLSGRERLGSLKAKFKSFLADHHTKAEDSSSSSETDEQAPKSSLPDGQDEAASHSNSSSSDGEIESYSKLRKRKSDSESDTRSGKSKKSRSSADSSSGKEKGKEKEKAPSFKDAGPSFAKKLTKVKSLKERMPDFSSDPSSEKIKSRIPSLRSLGMRRKKKKKRRSNSGSDSSSGNKRKDTSDPDRKKYLASVQGDTKEGYKLPTLEETPPSSPQSYSRPSSAAQSDITGRAWKHSSAPTSPSDLAHNFNLYYRGGDSSPVTLIGSLSQKNAAKHASQLSEISFASPSSPRSPDRDSPGRSVDHLSTVPPELNNQSPEKLTDAHREEGQESTCQTCGWAYPVPNPSVRQKREHKQHCGEFINVQQWLGVDAVGNENIPDPSEKRIEELPEAVEAAERSASDDNASEFPMASTHSEDDHKDVSDLSGEHPGIVDSGRSCESTLPADIHGGDQGSADQDVELTEETLRDGTERMTDHAQQDQGESEGSSTGPAERLEEENQSASGPVSERSSGPVVVKHIRNIYDSLKGSFPFKTSSSDVVTDSDTDSDNEEVREAESSGSSGEVLPMSAGEVEGHDNQSIPNLPEKMEKNTQGHDVAGVVEAPSKDEVDEVGKDENFVNDKTNITQDVEQSETSLSIGESSEPEQPSQLEGSSNGPAERPEEEDQSTSGPVSNWSSGYGVAKKFRTVYDSFKGSLPSKSTNSDAVTDSDADNDDEKVSEASSSSSSGEVLPMSVGEVDGHDSQSIPHRQEKMERDTPGHDVVDVVEAPNKDEVDEVGKDADAEETFSTTNETDSETRMPDTGGLIESTREEHEVEEVDEKDTPDESFVNDKTNATQDVEQSETSLSVHGSSESEQPSDNDSEQRMFDVESHDFEDSMQQGEAVQEPIPIHASRQSVQGTDSEVPGKVSSELTTGDGLDGNPDGASTSGSDHVEEGMDDRGEDYGSPTHSDKHTSPVPVNLEDKEALPPHSDKEVEEVEETESDISDHSVQESRKADAVDGSLADVSITENDNEGNEVDERCKDYESPDESSTLKNDGRFSLEARAEPEKSGTHPENLADKGQHEIESIANVDDVSAESASSQGDSSAIRSSMDTKGVLSEGSLGGTSPPHTSYERNYGSEDSPPFDSTSQRGKTGLLVHHDGGSSSRTQAETDFEQVVREQKTHDLICPVCGSCVTRRIILRKRKRTPISDDELRPSKSQVPATEPDDDSAGWGCLECFSFFIRRDNRQESGPAAGTQPRLPFLPVDEWRKGMRWQSCLPSFRWGLPTELGGIPSWGRPFPTYELPPAVAEEIRRMKKSPFPPTSPSPEIIGRSPSNIDEETEDKLPVSSPGGEIEEMRPKPGREPGLPAAHTERIPPIGDVPEEPDGRDRVHCVPLVLLFEYARRSGLTKGVPEESQTDGTNDYEEKTICNALAELGGILNWGQPFPAYDLPPAVAAEIHSLKKSPLPATSPSPGIFSRSPPNSDEENEDGGKNVTSAGNLTDTGSSVEPEKLPVSRPGGEIEETHPEPIPPPGDVPEEPDGRDWVHCVPLVLLFEYAKRSGLTKGVPKESELDPENDYKEKTICNALAELGGIPSWGRPFPTYELPPAVAEEIRRMKKSPFPPTPPSPGISERSPPNSDEKAEVSRPGGEIEETSPDTDREPGLSTAHTERRPPAGDVPDEPDGRGRVQCLPLVLLFEYAKRTGLTKGVPEESESHRTNDYKEKSICNALAELGGILNWGQPFPTYELPPAVSEEIHRMKKSPVPPTPPSVEIPQRSPQHSDEEDKGILSIERWRDLLGDYMPKDLLAPSEEIKESEQTPREPKPVRSPEHAVPEEPDDRSPLSNESTVDGGENDTSAAKLTDTGSSIGPEKLPPSHSEGEIQKSEQTPREPGIELGGTPGDLEPKPGESPADDVPKEPDGGVDCLPLVLLSKYAKRSGLSKAKDGQATTNATNDYPELCNALPELAGSLSWGHRFPTYELPPAVAEEIRRMKESPIPPTDSSPIPGLSPPRKDSEGGSRSGRWRWPFGKDTAEVTAEDNLRDPLLPRDPDHVINIKDNDLAVLAAGGTVEGTHNQLVALEEGQTSEKQGSEWEVLKSIVHGGLDVTLVSVGVVSSAVGGDASTITVVALGIANLFFGIIAYFGTITALYTNNRERYIEEVGGSFNPQGLIALLSFFVFGSLPPIVYGFSFRQSTNMYYKFGSMGLVALVCIAMLGTAKARIRSQSALAVVSILTTTAVVAAFVGFESGGYVLQLLQWVGFDSG